jgi:nucleoside-diphosphate-sugar epimerase
MATEFQRRLNSKCKIDFGALPYRKNEVWDMVGSNNKIKSMLGFKPKYDLKGAINQLIQ